MQPSQLEIQREVEALRDIKRRSSTQGGPGALILDPDLPNPSSPPSPTASYWSASSAAQQLNDGDSSSGSHEDSSSSEERATSSDDPFHLFWVPARLHPEIAPAEFRAFLKEHARTPPPDGTNTLGRSLTTSSPGLERKRSMLSRQYKPSETDDVDVEEETIVPIQRNRTVFTHAGPQLTISDLQRLEELAEEATKDGDPSKFRTALRRSFSLNVSPSAIDTMDDIPSMPDEADAPIIVPPPGQILRRAARTKIRKSSTSAAGEGREFSARRRRPTTKVTEPRTSSDLSSNDHASEQVDSPEQFRRPRTFSNESITSDEQTSHRSDPYGEETSIYDAYVREDPESEIARSIQSFMTPPPPLVSLTLPADVPKSSSADAASQPSLTYPTPEPELQHPQPQRLNIVAPIEETPRTPSPDTTLVSTTEEIAVALTFADIPIPTEKSASPVQKKERDRRGLFSKWGSGDKNGKKTAKAERDREKEAQRAEKDKEKESGFFGSLFGSKKKQDDSSSQMSGFTGSGRETAAALLGASKSSKGLPTSPSPQPGFQGPYARYPIHVERAIYRLSHIKLANPRRPLYEQVLISNLMFWYLGVINKTQNPTPAISPNQGPVGAVPVQQVFEQEEAQRGEAEERQSVEDERSEQEKQEREQKERERELQLQQQQQKEKSRRGTLTKAIPTQQGSRRAGEMLVKGPQYEMQHRVIEQEYHGPGYGYGSSSPSPGAVTPPRVHRQPSPPIPQSQSAIEPEPSMYVYPGGMDPHLQLDAMSPTPNSLLTSPAAPRTRPSPPSSPPTHGPQQADSPPQAIPTHRSRSPPPQNHNRYSPSLPAPGRSQPSRGPTRSLSATVSPGVPMSTDGKARKTVSAHAVTPSPNGRPRASIGSVPMPRGEEEDVPLAVYQQQRRR